MGIAGLIQTAAVEVARGVDAAQFLQRLAAVKVRGRISGIGGHHGFKLGQGAFERAGLEVLHGQPVTGEAARGILRQELFKGENAGMVQTARIQRMACPYFVPEAPLDASVWLRPPRAPLGELFDGTCSAGGSETRPAGECVRELCNFGYARGRCDRFPSSTEADAVRFSIASDRDGRVELTYLIEAEHRPAEHGVLYYAAGEVEGTESMALGAQARAFVGSYRRRLLVRAATS